MANPIISVIVPVYNIREQLNRCVDSLLRQTETNLEILLVDDGSSDGSGQICDLYADADARVRVIHKENGGLSAARNTGIEQARGDYFAFVDGDDFVSPDYLEVLLRACLEHGVPLAACGYVVYYGPERQTETCGPEPFLLTGEEAFKDILTMKNRIHVVAWNKLYARSLFENGSVRYPEGKCHEDVFTTWRLCVAAEKVAYVNRPCYYYVQREGSIMGTRFREKRLDALEALEMMRPYIEENSPVFDREYQYYVFATYLTMLNAMADSGYADEERFRRLAGTVTDMVPELRGNPWFGKKQALTAVCLRLGRRAFYLIRALYRKTGLGGKVV